MGFAWLAFRVAGPGSCCAICTLVGLALPLRVEKSAVTGFPYRKQGGLPVRGVLVGTITVLEKARRCSAGCSARAANSSRIRIFSLRLARGTKLLTLNSHKLPYTHADHRFLPWALVTRIFEEPMPSFGNSLTKAIRSLDRVSSTVVFHFC